MSILYRHFEGYLCIYIHHIERKIIFHINCIHTYRQIFSKLHIQRIYTFLYTILQKNLFHLNISTPNSNLYTCFQDPTLSIYYIDKYINVMYTVYMHIYRFSKFFVYTVYICVYIYTYKLVYILVSLYRQKKGLYDIDI